MHARSWVLFAVFGSTVVGCGGGASAPDASSPSDDASVARIDAAVPVPDGGHDAAITTSDVGLDAPARDVGLDSAPPFDVGNDAATCSLEGNWVHLASSGLTFYVHFGADRTFYFSNDPAFAESHIIGRASWSAAATDLTIGGMDPGGTPDECDTLTGIYAFVLSADCNTVTFTLVSELCDGRDAGVVATWSRGASDVDPCAIPDGDGDGHARHTCGGDDCADYDAAVHPGATEVCNASDDDCDALIDEALVCP